MGGIDHDNSSLSSKYCCVKLSTVVDSMYS